MSVHSVKELDAGELDSLRESLTRLREENEADIARARETLDELTSDHSATSASLRETVANAEYMVIDATGIIAQIDAALDRMASGTYGRCQACGEAIPAERLELRPYGATCVPCGSAQR